MALECCRRAPPFVGGNMRPPRWGTPCLFLPTPLHSRRRVRTGRPPAPPSAPPFQGRGLAAHPFFFVFGLVWFGARDSGLLLWLTLAACGPELHSGFSEARGGGLNFFLAARAYDPLLSA